MRFAVLLLSCFVCVFSFPSYAPCASDSESFLRVGSHTCARAMGKKGSDILLATHKDATLTAKREDGALALSVGRGETVTLNFQTRRLNFLLGESLWMVARVSDAGANGTLRGEDDTFQARCPSQISTMKPLTKNTGTMTYRAPCDLSKDVTITVVHSQCFFGCSTGAVASGFITPRQFYLTNITLTFRNEVDPSCSKPPPKPMPGLEDICHATTCWPGNSEECEGESATVPLKELPVSVSRWNSEQKKYEPLGQADAYTISDPRWQALLHGPTPLGGKSGKAVPGKLPSLFVSIDSSNTVYRIDNVSLSQKTATSKRIAWVPGVASQHHVLDKTTGELKAMVVSSGQPFGDTVGANGQHQFTQGGVYAVSPNKCHKLWPNPIDEPERMPSGSIVNRIVCHDPTGVCFFSNWNHEFDKSFNPTPRCFHWCALNDPNDPTSCSAGEPLAGGPETSAIPGKFCEEPQKAKDGSDVLVAAHGILIGSEVQDGDKWHLEIITSYSDGLMGMDKGVSFARKLFVTVQRSGTSGEATTVKATKYENFGTELTTDTLAGTDYDVRLDHMWRDGEGYVWFSTFGDHNAGEHVLDYNTGKLLLSFKGFEKYPHLIKPYNPSGITIVGGLGQAGAMAVVAVETVPPLPFIHGALFLVDISKNWTSAPSMKEQFV